MKYKVGDTVQIKSNAKEIQIENWAPSMDGCQGQIGTVTWFDDDDEGCSVATPNGFEFFYISGVLELIKRAEIKRVADMESFSTDDLLKELYRRAKA